MSSQCRKCGQPLSQPRTGRPRRYCSLGCRRAGEYEVRRASRRLERLEDERLELGIRLAEYALDRGYLPQRTRTTEVRRDAVLEEIAYCERRLRDLLDDPTPPGRDPA